MEKDKDQSDELEVLTILMEIYKKENWPFYYADPIQTIRHHMREWGLKLIDFADITGCIELAESILNKTQPLTLKEVWKLYKEWKIPARLLLHPYPLKTEKQRKMKPFNLN